MPARCKRRRRRPRRLCHFGAKHRRSRIDTPESRPHPPIMLDASCAMRKTPPGEDAAIVPLMVDRWRLNGSLQPITASQVRMYGFVFRVDRERIVQLCDRYLNIGHSTVHYEPPEHVPLTLDPVAPAESPSKTGIVIITFAHIGQLRSHAPYDDVGWTTETEATFWMLTTAHDERSGEQRRTWFVPYIFVDLPIAISMGREIYGYPKEIGWFKEDDKFAWKQHPADGGHADEFTLDAFAVERFDDRQFARRRVMTLTRRREAPLEVLGAAWNTLQDATRALKDEFLNAHPLRDVVQDVEDLWPPHVTAVLLKQIPHPAASRFATHQAVIEARQQVDLSTFAGGGWLNGAYRLDLASLQSHPISDDLGLATGDEGRGYWMDFDFVLQPGRQIWAISGDVS